MKIQDECRCCGSKDLTPIIDLSEQFVASSYHRGLDVPKLPLRVDFCDYCFHRQLSGVIDPNPLYDNSFFDDYHSSYQNYADNLVNDCLKWWKVNRKKQKRISVLDIGCNDATLLKLFEKKKCLVQGVEPAENLREISKEKRIRVKMGYWGDAKTSQSLGRYDLLTVIGLFDKIDYLDAFLDDCVSSIVEDGCIVLEIPYQGADLGFHNINHPMLSYFLVHSFKTVIEKKGLVVERITKASYGGLRLRFFLGLNGEHCPQLQTFIDQEKETGLFDSESYKDLKEASDEKSAALKKWTDELRAEGKTIIGCGSCHESNALIAYADLDLDYIIDNNAMIWGYRTPNETLVHPFKYLLKEENESCVLFFSPYTRHFDMKEVKEMKLDNFELVDFFKSF